MTTTHEAAAAVQHLSKQYASVIELGKVLERIGSLENYEREIQARIDSVKVALAEQDAIRQLAEAAVKTAYTQANETVKHGEANAAALLADAKTKAQAIVDEANQQADDVLVRAGAARSAVEAQTSAAVANLAELEAKIVARQAHLAAVEGQIEQFRRDAAALLG